MGQFIFILVFSIFLASCGTREIPKADEISSVTIYALSEGLLPHIGLSKKDIRALPKREIYDRNEIDSIYNAILSLKPDDSFSEYNGDLRVVVELNSKGRTTDVFYYTGFVEIQGEFYEANDDFRSAIGYSRISKFDEE